MITLIYHSVANKICSAEELSLFLTSVRNKNIRLNVTGVLFYHQGNIMQIIEGEYDTIIELFERIKSDHRHSDIVKLVDFPISKRSFSDWSMAFQQLTNQDWVKVTGYLNIEDEQIGLPQQSEKYGYLKVLIDSFILENGILHPESIIHNPDFS